MNTSQRAARSILALAGIEARRHLRNPILWLGTCATIGQAAGPYADGQGPLPDPWVTEDYEGFLSAWGWLFLAAFVTAVVTVNRHLEPRTAQLFAGQPTDAGQRMIALLLAGVVPAGLAGLAAGATCAVVARAGGIATGFSLNMVPTVTSVYLVPTVAEAAVAVAIVAVGYTFGVACALNISSLIANLIPGVLFAFAGIGMFWIWVYPVSVFSLFATPLSHTDLGPAPTEDVKAQWQILHPWCG